MTELIDNKHVALVRDWKYFDAAWYVREYPDVAMLRMDPAYHYLWLGAKIGRRPSDAFHNFQNRHLSVDELIREIRRNPQPSSSATAADALYLNAAEQPAVFLDPQRGDPASVQNVRVAVHAHIYYTDLAEEFADYFRAIPCPFDLYISIADGKAYHRLKDIYSTIPNVKIVDVRILTNRGRDIAPFLVEFGGILSKYDVIAHVHTKKSLYNNGSTDGWRGYVLDSLFESSDIVSYFIDVLNSGKYGIIYPQCFHNLPYQANTWLANNGLARLWASRFGVQNLPDSYFDFPVGSMFWAKVDALRPLLSAQLNWQDFPAEEGQADGTLAHCIERMLGVVPTSRYFKHGVIRDSRTPSWSRWRLDQFTDRPLALLEAMIADPSVKIIAFDIFDTLLVRPLLDPDYVKRLLHAEHQQMGSLDFHERRIDSERRARELKGADVDIYDIYHHMATRSSMRIEADREIALEIASVRPRCEVQALLDYARKKGKRVVLASDMFLPRAVIEDMLGRCGVRDWDALYLSSEIGVRKDTGRLYQYILSEENITPRQMIMVGDNERSDFQIPSDLGIGTIHVLRPVSMMRAMPRLANLIPDAHTAPVSEQFLFGAIALRNFNPISYPDFLPDAMFGASAKAIGYSLLGPIVATFSQWLVEQSQEHGIERLYFLAREGKFLKKAYDAWTEGQSRNVRSDYLLVSRRAVTVPCLRTIQDVFDIASSNDFLGASMAMFLSERFGTVLDEQTWTDCEYRKLWNRNDPLRIENGNIDHLRAFLEYVAPHIFEIAKVERGNALKYCKSMGLVEAYKAAVVDVGYGATIQKHLMKLLDHRIEGLYMMTDKRALGSDGGLDMIAAGCFIDGAQRNESASPFFLHSFILEKMLSADDEQVINYSNDGAAHFRTKSEYIEIGAAVRTQLQEGALDFVRDCLRFSNETGASLKFNKTTCENIFVEFVMNMSNEEKELFSSLALDDFYCGRGIVSG